MSDADRDLDGARLRMGGELYKRVAKLMQSGAWQRRSDDQRRKALVELHRMMDTARPARLTRLRRQAQSELAQVNH